MPAERSLSKICPFCIANTQCEGDLTLSMNEPLKDIILRTKSVDTMDRIYTFLKFQVDLDFSRSESEITACQLLYPYVNTGIIL